MGQIKQRLHFPSAFKEEIVRQIRTSGRDIPEIVREHGLKERAVRRWIRQAEIDEGTRAFGGLTTGELEELAALKREMRRSGRSTPARATR
jgi:transposase